MRRLVRAALLALPILLALGIGLAIVYTPGEVEFNPQSGHADSADGPVKVAEVSGNLRQTVTLRWNSDDGTSGYQLLRDGVVVATAGPLATSTRFLVSTGQHTLAVVALPPALPPPTTTEPPPTTAPTTTAPPPTTTVAEPCAGVQVTPGDAVQAKIDDNLPGTTYCFASGVYRLSSPIVPKTGDILIGDPGATLNGAQLITDKFTPTPSGLWVAEGMTAEAKDPPIQDITQPCRDVSDVCMWRNDVYVDDQPLIRVLTLEALIPGRFFFDYPNDRIYLAADPAGHKVELAVTGAGIQYAPGGSFDVTVRGLTIEKFATPVQKGAIRANEGWTIENNEVRLNHAIGVQGGHVVRGNHIHDNGQMGFAGYGTGTLVENNEISRNEYAQFGCWEGGGTKFLWTRNLIARGNFVHHHTFCPGLWADWNNIYVTFENNRVEDNGGPGIFQEAGFDAVIRNNTVLRNGYGPEFAGWVDGGGILVNSSANVEVYGNVLEGNLHGITATYTDRGSADPAVCGQPTCKREVRNLYVHDNTIRMGAGGVVAAGLASDLDGVYTTHNNRFQGNTYFLCGGPFLFAWGIPGSTAPGYRYLSLEQWRAAGNDSAGSFTTGC